MDTSKHPKNKPGLEEAIHPEIGNEAAWEKDPHALNLRITDPLKSLDERMLDDSTLNLIEQKWNKDLEGDAPGPELVSEDQLLKETVPADQFQEAAEERSKEQQAEPRESKEETLSGKEEIVEEKTVKPGKRIRKIAEKAKKEEAKKIEARLKSRQLKESSLSDFTSWLKGLSGSEYVHPYEDDYAISQGLEAQDEGISETFADLLAAQGYKDQAIAMYTRLIEKFPEKSRFFAAKIEALQS